MKKDFRITVCQLRTELERDRTMEKAASLVRLAAQGGADIVALGEMFCCPYSGRFFRAAAKEGHERTVEEMSRWARENGVYLVGGSIPEKDGERLYNSCFVFDRDGEIVVRHRKVHLFDVELPDMRFKESDDFSPGSDVTVFDTEFGKMGAAVCFDLRFPELFRAMAVRGARVIFVPAQFNMTTGPAHWAETLKIRAVDNELFIVGASAARYEGFDYECWGHSSIIGPYGETLAAADEKERIISADIDLSRIDEVRAQLPTFLRLRRDVYTVTE